VAQRSALGLGRVKMSGRYPPDRSMSKVEQFEILVLGSGEAGKYLAWTRAKEGSPRCSGRAQMVGRAYRAVGAEMRPVMKRDYKCSAIRRVLVLRRRCCIPGGRSAARPEAQRRSLANGAMRTITGVLCGVRRAGASSDTRDRIQCRGRYVAEERSNRRRSGSAP
jgi:hypothetical protein